MKFSNLHNAYYNSTRKIIEWGRVLDSVPRGRLPNGVKNSDREKLIAKAVKLLSEKEYDNPDQVIYGAIEAIGRSALQLGHLTQANLRDLAKKETSVNRLIREVVLRAASPKNRRQDLSAHRIQSVFLTFRYSPAGQGRSSFRGIEKTGLPLDRQPSQTLSGVQKTEFFGLPPGEGFREIAPPADNMGVKNIISSKNEENPVKTSPGWPGCREADLDTINQAYDNSTRKIIDWDWILEPVPRGRSRNGAGNSDREKLIVKAVKLLSEKEYDNPDQVIYGAIEAIGRSAMHLGSLTQANLRDLAKKETSVNRLIREVVLRGATPKNRRQELSAHRIQSVFLTFRDSLAGQGRSSFRDFEKTGLPLDRQRSQTLSVVQKTKFFGLPPGEGFRNSPHPTDNMGVENIISSKNEPILVKTSPGWPGCREADLDTINHAYDNSTYRKQ